MSKRLHLPLLPELQRSSRERKARICYKAVLLLALMSAVGFVYYLGFLYMYGPAVPTPTRTEPLNQFGSTVYITVAQKEWFTRLRLVLLFCALAFVGTVAVQKMMGIKIGGPVSELPVGRQIDLPWKRALRKIYACLFGVVMLAGALSFCYFIVLTLIGSSTPTAPHTEPLWSHGRAVYVAVIQKRLLNLLWMFFAGGMPVLAVLALFLHFAVGVQIFSRSESK